MMSPPRRGTIPGTGPASPKSSVWFHKLGRLGRPFESSMRRDTPGPVREAGVRHREICPTEPRPRPRHPAQDVLDIASRAPRRRFSPSPSPRGTLRRAARSARQLTTFWKPRCAAVSAGRSCRRARSNVDVCVVPCLPRVVLFFPFSCCPLPASLVWRVEARSQSDLVLRFLISVLPFISLLACGERTEQRAGCGDCLHVGLDGRRMPWLGSQSGAAHKGSVWASCCLGRPASSRPVLSSSGLDLDLDFSSHS